MRLLERSNHANSAVQYGLLLWLRLAALGPSWWMLYIRDFWMFRAMRNKPC